MKAMIIPTQLRAKTLYAPQYVKYCLRGLPGRTKGFCRAYLLTRCCSSVLRQIEQWLVAIVQRIELEKSRCFEWYNVRTSLRQCSAHLSHEVPLLPLPVPLTSPFPSLFPWRFLRSSRLRARQGGRPSREGRTERIS